MDAVVWARRVKGAAHRMAALETRVFLWLARAIERQTATPRSRLRFSLGVIALGVVICSVAIGGTAVGQQQQLAVCHSNGGPPGPVDNVVNAYSQSMTAWPQAIINALNGTFFLIWGATFLFAYVDAVIGSGGHVVGLGWGVLRTALRFAVAAAAFLQAPVWGPGIINGILQTVDSVTGGTGIHAAAWQSLSPGSVFMNGACIAGTILHGGVGYNIITDTYHAIVAGFTSAITAVGIIIFYAIVMLSIVLVRLEVPIVLAIGSILCLGLAAPDLFLGLPMQYIGALVGLAAKIAALVLLVSKVQDSSTSWLAAIQSSALDPTAGLIIMASIFALSLAAFFVPMVVGTLGGSPAMTLGNVVGAFTSLNSFAQNFTPGSGGGGGGGGRSGGGGGETGGEISAGAESSASEAAMVAP